MADIRVGVVSWNTAAMLRRCLAALPAALGDSDAEVVVVDNASDDDSAGVVAAFAGVRLIRNTVNRGYAAAMNQALAGTTAPVLIALNPDTEPAPGSLAALARALDEQPGAGLVAPRLSNVDGSLQHSVYRFPSVAVAGAVALPSVLHRGWLGRHFWLEGSAPHDRSGDVDWAVGAVHCIRRSALRGDPPYRERWFMYVEDLDLCWRLHQRGWMVWFDADVTVAHVGNAAGRQAWGAYRTARWVDPTYQWYAEQRGPAAVRLWAAVNVAGLAVKLAFATVMQSLPLPGRPERRRRAETLRHWLSLHARKLVAGPAAALPGPPPAGS